VCTVCLSAVVSEGCGSPGDETASGNVAARLACLRRRALMAHGSSLMD
jgi:hypothetical protein